MTRDDIIQWAKEAGFSLYAMHDVDGEDLGESVEADDFDALVRLTGAVAAAKPGSMIAVPFDLIASACSAIDKKRDAPKTLAELRRYTTGDLSCAALAAAPQAPAAVEPVAQDLLSHKAP